MRSTILKTIIFVLLLVPLVGSAAEADDLQQQIRDRQARIETLKRQAAAFQASLEQKRREGASLANQIAILVDKIEKTKIDIQTSEAIIETTTLQIRELEDSIRAREQQLATNRQELSGLVRWNARTQNQSALKIFFTSASFSDFTNQLKYLRTVQMSMSDLIDTVEKEKTKLSSDKSSLEGKRRELVADVDALTSQRQSLEDQEDTKTYILAETKSSEQRFAALLDAAKREQVQTSAEITSLEQSVREKLKADGIQTTGEVPGFIWPAPNNRGITALFHDPDYPFRRAFEHTGIDIRLAQGNPVRAAASGYVAQARNGGVTGYSYIMIVHDGGIATVYGHISQINVQRDTFVSQGQVIGRSGGLPGTSGAGPFSTGAHLHFEVRKNGIPVNPLSYLP